MSFLCFNYSYLFSVLILGIFVLFLMLIMMSTMMYVKFIIVLVYISGVVVFILYVSCMCWLTGHKFTPLFLFFSIFVIFLVDKGASLSVGGLGECLWMYLYFAFLFNILVSKYSLLLFKVSGSLRL